MGTSNSKTQFMNSIMAKSQNITDDSHSIGINQYNLLVVFNKVRSSFPTLGIARTKIYLTSFM